MDKTRVRARRESIDSNDGAGRATGFAPDDWTLAKSPEGHDVVIGRVDRVWAYEMTVVESNGVLVVARLTLYPVNDQVFPVAGLTSRHLRQVPFRGHPAVAALVRAHRVARRIADLYGIGKPPRRRRRRSQGRGRPARSLERLAVVAYWYSEACASSRAPNREVSAKFRTTPTKIRDDVIAARRNGLLTGTHQRGVPGGVLTEKCLEILRALKAQRRQTDAGENVGRQPRKTRQITAK